MTQTAIEEIVRIASPAPAPMGLSCDGTDIWICSYETSRVYGIKSNTGAIFEEGQAPGKPIGMVVTGDALRVVCSEGGENDTRMIRRYVMGHGFKSNEGIACPEDTGSFLAYDGSALFLSQRYLNQILELSDDGAVARTIPIGHQITGIIVIGGRFYVTVTDGNDSANHRLARVDAHGEQRQYEEIARFNFLPRSLGFDGTKLWTTDRDRAELVGFALPA